MIINILVCIAAIISLVVLCSIIFLIKAGKHAQSYKDIFDNALKDREKIKKQYFSDNKPGYS